MTTVNDIIESLIFKLHVREKIAIHNEINQKSFYSKEYKTWFPRWFQDEHDKSLEKTTQENK